MKNFFLTLLHAAVGGALAGGAAAASGNAGYKAIGLAAVGSAFSSILSFFAQSPFMKKAAGQ